MHCIYGLCGSAPTDGIPVNDYYRKCWVRLALEPMGEKEFPALPQEKMISPTELPSRKLNLFSLSVLFILHQYLENGKANTVWLP